MTTMLSHILLAVLVSSCLATPTGPFNPEETLFVFARCMEDNLRDDASRNLTFFIWKNWELEPADDRSTHCYVKCVFDKLGIYDSSSKRFKPEVIANQLKQYPDLVDKSKAEAYIDALTKLPVTENDCTAVFKAYQPIHQTYKETSRNLLHGNKELYDKLYEELGGDIRQMGQSYFEFCENKYYPSGSADRLQLCKIRQYVVLDDEKFKKHTDCIMKGLRYISKDNLLDRDEIKRDFKEVNKNTEELDNVLDRCQSEEPKEASEVSYHYYKCLVESAVASDFKEAFDYREIRSQRYAYNLMEKQKYKRSDVQAQVMEIDGKQCPQ